MTSEKCYAIVCRCNGKDLKAYENLNYYQMIARQYKNRKLFNR